MKPPYFAVYKWLDENDLKIGLNFQILTICTIRTAGLYALNVESITAYTAQLTPIPNNDGNWLHSYLQIIKQKEWRFATCLALE